MARKHRVWRFQRSTMAGDVVTCMTHDRQHCLHSPMSEFWELNFNGRHTFYAVARVVGTVAEPRLQIFNEVTEGEWK